MGNQVRNMHYDFKQRLNKIDSKQSVNLRVPEIDRILNEGLYVFIKRIVEPRNTTDGVERNTRNIDDIRTLIVDNHSINTSKITDNEFEASLPENFLFHLSSRTYCEKGSCKRTIETVVQKHGRKFRESLFYKSSFEWKEVNILYSGKGVLLFSDGTFVINKFILDYIKKPLYIHTAEDFHNGKYTLPDGTELTGYQNCELPESVCTEIVDIAVLIATGNLSSDYNIKYSKIQLTD